MTLFDHQPCSSLRNCHLPLILSLFLIALAGSLILPKTSYAQEQCVNLETNQQWNSSIKKINTLIESNKYDEALKIAREIYPLCPQSPILNYFIAQCLKETGDPVKATQFYQTASDNTFKIATPPHIAQMIWYARYESEYPDRTAESIKAFQDRTSTLQEQNEALETKNRELEHQLLTQGSTFTQNQTDIAIGMWTGAGLGIAGLAMSGAFGYLAMNGNENRSVKVEPKGNSFSVEFSSEAAVYWSLFGAGVALVVAGSVMAGIFGYRYTHPRTDNDLAISITPLSASFSMTF